MRACAAGYAPLLDVGAVRASSSSTAVTGSFVASGGTDPILFAPSEIRFPLSMDRLGAASSLPPASGCRRVELYRDLRCVHTCLYELALELPNLRGFPRAPEPTRVSSTRPRQRTIGIACTDDSDRNNGRICRGALLTSFCRWGTDRTPRRGTPLRAPTLESWYASTQTRCLLLLGHPTCDSVYRQAHRPPSFRLLTYAEVLNNV
jgi:hypothetical protein